MHIVRLPFLKGYSSPRDVSKGLSHPAAPEGNEQQKLVWLLQSYFQAMNVIFHRVRINMISEIQDYFARI